MRPLKGNLPCMRGWLASAVRLAGEQGATQIRSVAGDMQHDLSPELSVHCVSKDSEGEEPLMMPQMQQRKPLDGCGSKGENHKAK